MTSLRVLSAAEQVAGHLRRELLGGSLAGLMPGSDRLARELGIGHNTINAALDLLENEGLLVPQGAGRRRRIEIPAKAVSPALRIAFLNFDPPAKSESFIIEVLHGLSDHGHTVFFTEKTLVELGMDLRRIARLVNKTEADAWIVAAGSRRVLEWFAARRLRTFSIFGAPHGLPVAGVGPDYRAVLAAFRRVLDLGHRRIVFLAFHGRRPERPGPLWRTLFQEMENHGIKTGSYNMPEWEDSPQGFRRLLDSLFGHTPPTALMIDEPPQFFAALQYCGQRGLRVPQDVSLVCLQESPDFAYCLPAVAHVRRDHGPVVRRIVRWADNVASGKDDCRLSVTKAGFVEGGTLGPA
jgi:DNA-binding LacI/PurR family transcriptional regulator